MHDNATPSRRRTHVTPSRRRAISRRQCRPVLVPGHQRAQSRNVQPIASFRGVPRPVRAGCRDSRHAWLPRRAWRYRAQTGRSPRPFARASSARSAKAVREASPQKRNPSAVGMRRSTWPQADQADRVSPNPLASRDAPHFVALVRAGATFTNGKLVEQPCERSRSYPRLPGRRRAMLFLITPDRCPTPKPLCAAGLTRPARSHSAHPHRPWRTRYELTQFPSVCSTIPSSRATCRNRPVGVDDQLHGLILVLSAELPTLTSQ